MMEDKINTLEMWVYRRIGYLSWKEKKTNKAVLDKLEMRQDLLKEAKTRQLKYFGHIKRQDSLLKNILDGRVEGKRA
jgi:dihydroneopterin aldolase